MNGKKGTTVVAVVVIMAMLPIVMYGISSVVYSVKKSARLSQSLQTRIIINNLAREIASRAVDTDSDDKLEAFAPDAEGYVPSTIPARKTDYWKNKVRLCSWDLRGGNSNPEYSSTIGEPRTDLVARLVSPGRNGSFETDCSSNAIMGDDVGQEIFEHEIRDGKYNRSGFSDTGSLVRLTTPSDRVTVGGTAVPTEKLEVHGGVLVGDTATNTLGAVKFNGNSMFGYNGAEWVDLLHGPILINTDINLTGFSIDKYHYIDAASNVNIQLPDPSVLAPGDTIRFKVAPVESMGHFGILKTTLPATIDGETVRAMWADEEATLTWTGSMWTKTQGVTKPLTMCAVSNKGDQNGSSGQLYLRNDCGSSAPMWNNKQYAWGTGPYDRVNIYRPAEWHFSNMTTTYESGHVAMYYRYWVNGVKVYEKNLPSYVFTYTKAHPDHSHSIRLKAFEQIIIGVSAGSGTGWDNNYFKAIETPEW